MNARLALSMPLLVLATCATAFAPAPVYKEPPKPPRSSLEKAMQGTWLLFALGVQGTAAGGSPENEVKVEVTKDKVTIVETGKKTTGNNTFAYKLDMKSKPSGIDLTPARGEKGKILGIYQIEKDKLTIALNESGDVRPKSLKEKGTIILIFRKAKAKK